MPLPTTIQEDQWHRERVEAARRARQSYDSNWTEVVALQKATRGKISEFYRTTGYARRPVDNLSKLAELVNYDTNWPAFPETSNRVVGRFARRPLEKAEVVQPRPSYFSSFPVTHTK